MYLFILLSVDVFRGLKPRHMLLHVGCRIAVMSVETNVYYILVQLEALETHLKLSFCFKSEIVIYFKLSKSL